MLMRFTKRGGYAPPLRAALTAALLALPAAACEGLLDVEDPDTTRDRLLNNAAAIPALRAAVLVDFIPAYEQMIAYGGMLGDEFHFSETFPTRLQVDRRNIDPNNGTTLGVFNLITTAGATADFVHDRLMVVDTTPGDGASINQRAEARSLGGYSLITLAESYCNGVPISRVNRSDDGALEFRYGPGVTNAAMLDSAIVRFDAALAITGTNTTQQRLARIGKARALVDLGRFADAAALVTEAAVPTTFVYQLEHSNNSGGENNFVWFFNINNERVSVSDSEQGEGLPYRTPPTGVGLPGGRDPRVLWFRRPGNVGFDRRTPLYDALKYPDRPAFTVLASGVEARLIQAEALLNQSPANVAGAFAILNTLRSQVQPLMQLLNYDYVRQQAVVGYAAGQGATLPALDVPATRAEAIPVFFRERAFWLWLTAHRLGDQRRLIRQYGFSQAQAGFPVAAQYGTDVNFPIPVQELNNPNEDAGECFDRDA